MCQHCYLARQESRAYTTGEPGPHRNMVSIHGNLSTSNVVLSEGSRRGLVSAAPHTLRHSFATNLLEAEHGHQDSSGAAGQRAATTTQICKPRVEPGAGCRPEPGRPDVPVVMRLQPTRFTSGDGVLNCKATQDNDANASISNSSRGTSSGLVSPPPNQTSSDTSCSRHHRSITWSRPSSGVVSSRGSAVYHGRFASWITPGPENAPP